MSENLISNVIIEILVDYGAEEYIWYSSFTNITDLIEWWENVPSIDILNYDPQQLINDGTVRFIPANSEIDFGVHYSPEKGPRIMMDNDYSSYLYYAGKQYQHKGHKTYLHEHYIVK